MTGNEFTRRTGSISQSLSSSWPLQPTSPPSSSITLHLRCSWELCPHRAGKVVISQVLRWINNAVCNMCWEVFWGFYLGSIWKECRDIIAFPRIEEISNYAIQYILLPLSKGTSSLGDCCSCTRITSFGMWLTLNIRNYAQHNLCSLSLCHSPLITRWSRCYYPYRSLKRWEVTFP